MLRKTLTAYLLPLGVLFILSSATPAVGQDRRFHTDYTVEVSNPETSLFHVTANVQNINQPRLDLSLPVWTPGWYTIENYAKNILWFKITGEEGAALPHIMTSKQTWSVDTKGRHQIRIEFDYRTTTLFLDQAKIAKDFAFFTGTQLFLMAEGHRATPSTVHFIIPAGWQVISALKETSDPLTFIAPDYDTLVDAPTELGHFDVTRFEVEGKPHYFVTTPAGDFPSDKAQQVANVMAKVASTASAIFGKLPYEKYLYFYFFNLVESSQVSAGLEHMNSYVALVGAKGAEARDYPIESWAGGVAHEFFHLWNVKRIRPIEMWPYDYSQENTTPLLWVSEGFTNYYADVIAYRAGFRNRKSFLDGIAGAIRRVENNEARRYISPAESSVRIWLGYDTPPNFQISTYTQGQNLAALLDLSIRHDTNGKAGLDDVMRGLYREFYQRGKGFSTEDMIGIINRLTRRDYHDFYRRFVWGVEVPDYDTILGYAGYRLEKSNVKRIYFGFARRPGASGETISVTSVDPASTAAAAGLMAGDLILKVDSTNALRFGWFEDGKAGQTVKLTIKRAGEEKVLTMIIGSRNEVAYDLVEMAQATPDQIKIREEWLAVSK
jgi:predicted metalloprotease with PDZ domain